MVFGRVQRGEIEPVGLDLGALGHIEAQLDLHGLDALQQAAHLVVAGDVHLVVVAALADGAEGGLGIGQGAQDAAGKAPGDEGQQHDDQHDGADDGAGGGGLQVIGSLGVLARLVGVVLVEGVGLGGDLVVERIDLLRKDALGFGEMAFVEGVPGRVDALVHITLAGDEVGFGQGLVLVAADALLVALPDGGQLFPVLGDDVGVGRHRMLVAGPGCTPPTCRCGPDPGPAAGGR